MHPLPEAGKTYASRIDPAIRFHVEAVHVIEVDEDSEARFVVEGCDPADKGDAGAIKYEVTAEEWAEHGFSPERLGIGT